MFFRGGLIPPLKNQKSQSNDKESKTWRNG